MLPAAGARASCIREAADGACSHCVLGRGGALVVDAGGLSYSQARPVQNPKAEAPCQQQRPASAPPRARARFRGIGAGLDVLATAFAHRSRLSPHPDTCQRGSSCTRRRCPRTSRTPRRNRRSSPGRICPRHRHTRCLTGRAVRRMPCSRCRWHPSRSGRSRRTPAVCFLGVCFVTVDY